MIQYDKMSFHEDLSLRLNNILNGWEHLACENSPDSSLDMAKTASILIIETLQVSLKNQWPLKDNSVKSHLVSLLDVSYRKLNQICKETSAMCRALMELVPSPWGSPILQSIMREPSSVSHEACVSFCSMEHPDVLRARIEILMESRHDELAYNLAVCCQQCGSPGGETFYKEAIIILNYRLGQIYRLTEEMSKMSCDSGVQFINRLLDVNMSPKLALAECLTQVLLVQDLVLPSEFCCTAALMKLWVRLHAKSKTSLEYLKPQVKKLAALALTSAHQYLLVDVLYEQYGLDLMSLYIEVYIQAITMDINHLENLKLHEEHASILEMEAHLASVFTKMATLFDDEYCGVAKECILTAFTLEPTQERLNTLETHSLRLQGLEPDLPVLSPMMIAAEEPTTRFIPRIPCQGECYCEEKGQCRQGPALPDNMQNSDMECDDLPHPSIEATKMDTSGETADFAALEKCWDLDDCSNVYPVHSPVLDSGLPGVSSEILKDLVIVLESARSKSATWDKEWFRLGPSCEEYLVTETECKRIILESLELQIPVEIPNRHFQRRTNGWLPSANVQVEVPVPSNVSTTLLPEVLDQCDNANPLESDTNVALCPTEIDATKSLPASSWTPVDILNNLALPKTFKALDNSMSSSDITVDRNELKLVAQPDVAASPLTLHVVPKKKNKARRVIKVKNCIQTSGRKEVIVSAASGQAYILSVPLNSPQAGGGDAVQVNAYSIYGSRSQQRDEGCGASSGTATRLLPSTTCPVVAAPKLDFEGTIPKMVSENAAINCQTVALRPAPGHQASKRRSELKSSEGQQKSRKKMFVSKKREQDGNMWFSIRNRHGLMEYKKARKKEPADATCSEVPIGSPNKSRMHVVRNYNKHERSARAKAMLYGDQASVTNNVKGVVLAPSKLIVPSQPPIPPQPPPDPQCYPTQQPPPPSFPLLHHREPENTENIVVDAPGVPTYPCPIMVPANSPVPAEETGSVMTVRQVVDVQPEVKRVDSPVNTTTVVIVEPPPEPKVKMMTAPTCVDLHLDSMPIIVSETSPVVILSPLKDKFRITNPVCVLERLDAHVFTRELQAMKMMKLEREKTSYDRTLICETCNKTFCSRYSLKRHLKAVHNLDQSPMKSARRSGSSSRRRMKHKRPREDISKIAKCIEYVSNDTAADVMSSRETEEVVIDVKGTHDPESVDASAVVPCASRSCSSSSDEAAESCGPESPCLSRTLSVNREDTDDDSLNSETESRERMDCSAALVGEKRCPCCDDGSPKKFKTNLTQLRLYRKPQSLELSPRTRSTSQRLGSESQ